jgi:hypothetical protein
MSSVKQEVAAILMDYTDKIQDEVYISILNELAAIPDHKDPKKACEIQKEFDNTKNKLNNEVERNDILLDEVFYLKNTIFYYKELLDCERRSQLYLKERNKYIYDRMLWFESICEEYNLETANLKDNRLLSSREYYKYGISVDFKTIHVKKTEEILQDISSLFDIDNDLEKEKESDIIDENNFEDDSYCLDNLFSKFDNIKYGYYIYISPKWWDETLMSRLTTYLLNGYKTLYDNEWNIYIGNCIVINDYIYTDT